MAGAGTTKIDDAFASLVQLAGAGSSTITACDPGCSDDCASVTVSELQSCAS
jgi:hypothetical protein